MTNLNDGFFQDDVLSNDQESNIGNNTEDYDNKLKYPDEAN